MPLTNTTHLSSFTRPLPEASTFAFPPAPAPTHVTFPPKSTLTTQLHFHATHTEYLKVISGAALVTVSGRSYIVKAENGEVEVPRHARHEWMRFDRRADLLRSEQRETQAKWFEKAGNEDVEKLRASDLVVEERTEPADGEKEIFFRNLFSTFSETAYQGGWMGSGEILRTLQVMVVMWELDNYVVMVDCQGWRGGWRKFVEDAVTFAIMGSAYLLGRPLGLTGVNEEYTPKELRTRWQSHNESPVTIKKEL